MVTGYVGSIDKKQINSTVLVQSYNTVFNENLFRNSGDETLGQTDGHD
jgi:hypothetical protein